MGGMWRDPGDPVTEARQAAEILADPDLFDEAARLMLTEWPHAAQQNLTNLRRSGRSWVGQAACCWLAGLSESATRAAWWLLTSEERTAANRVADEVVKNWRRVHRHALIGGPYA